MNWTKESWHNYKAWAGICNWLSQYRQVSRPYLGIWPDCMD